MKFKRKTLMAGAATAALAVAGGGLLASAGAAFAGGAAPAWEPDGNAAAPYGSLFFYNAAGQQITSGNNLNNLFQFVVASTARDTNATTGNLAFYNPQHGVLPASWTGTSEGSTVDTGLTSANTPANVLSLAGTNPVVASATGANLTTWLQANVPDTTAGYANIIQVRLQDSGPRGAGNSGGSTYWETDVAYNNTSASITVDGVVVAPGTWTELFPLSSVSSTALTISPAGPSEYTGTAVTLNAAVTASSTAGAVQFYDGSTLLGTVATAGGAASFGPFTPANGAHPFSAVFVPAQAVSSPGTTGATFVAGSTSNTVNLSVAPAPIATSTALAVANASIHFGDSDTLTANITEADSPVTAGEAGSVQFFSGTTSLGTVTTNDGTTGEYKLVTTALPVGSDSVTAVFTPTSSAYASSTSAPVSVTVAAALKCSLAGSSCTDVQNLQVTVNAGSITITTPYTSSNPFVLPALALSADGSYLSSSATFPAPAGTAAQQIDVTSTLAGDPGWTLSVTGSDLSDGNGHTISAAGLGLTNGALLNTTTFPGTVTFTGEPAHNPSPLTADADTNHGLSGGPYTFAATPAGDGTAVMDGTLTLLAPTSTPAGTYTGTLTFSVS